MLNGKTPYSTNVRNAPSNVPVSLVASTTATINTTYIHATEINSIGNSKHFDDLDVRQFALL